MGSLSNISDLQQSVITTCQCLSCIIHNVNGALFDDDVCTYNDNCYPSIDPSYRFDVCTCLQCTIGGPDSLQKSVGYKFEICNCIQCEASGSDNINQEYVFRVCDCQICFSQSNGYSVQVSIYEKDRNNSYNVQVSKREHAVC
jgi:hypothetical protein